MKKQRITLNLNETDCIFMKRYCQKKDKNMSEVIRNIVSDGVRGQKQIDTEGIEWKEKNGK